ncbi:energy-coupling factor transporter transmembrane component T [Lachnospira multipara]|uniref:energy-coupling factor transporter transmembrane component T n=1 Tax=Lachnospira multipara TaxID=28051 RepID=UPI000404E6A4|nr:energy-coupling factor transporter transmembrane component T [Lachnospira multipara]
MNSRCPFFTKMHPLVLLIYILGILIVTMSSLNPLLLSLSLISGIAVLVFLKGRKAKLVHIIFFSIPILIFMILIQPLFYHTGQTVLFYVNESAVYKENYIYGGIVSLMLIAGVVWCMVLRELLDSEKIYYLFGKLSPTLGLFFTMILRFIPLMRERLEQIHEGEISMGRIGPNAGHIATIRNRLKEVSILVGWSLESSIETANSMESRGYGLKGRTSYNRFNFKGLDIGLIILESLALVYMIAVLVTKGFRVYYLPVIILNKWDIFNILGLIVFASFALLPIIQEIIYKIWEAMNND